MGVRRWRELVIDREKGALFYRPKPTAGCSAKGGRRRRRIRKAVVSWDAVDSY
jgi:hypothetical protein